MATLLADRAYRSRASVRSKRSIIGYLGYAVGVTAFAMCIEGSLKTPGIGVWESQGIWFFAGIILVGVAVVLVMESRK